MLRSPSPRPPPGRGRQRKRRRPRDLACADSSVAARRRFARRSYITIEPATATLKDSYRSHGSVTVSPQRASERKKPVSVRGGITRQVQTKLTRARCPFDTHTAQCCGDSSGPTHGERTAGMRRRTVAMAGLHDALRQPRVLRAQDVHGPIRVLKLLQRGLPTAHINAEERRERSQARSHWGVGG